MSYRIDQRDNSHMQFMKGHMPVAGRRRSPDPAPQRLG
jgi:hypothetical protein